MNRLFATALSILCLFACGCSKDNWGQSKIVIENASSHKVKFVSDEGSFFQYIEGVSGINVELPAGATYDSGWSKGTSSMHLTDRIGRRVFATFDDDYEFAYTLYGKEGKSICDEYYWNTAYPSNRKYKVIYTFTFTDEDYERALEVSVDGGREHYYGERH